jgi:hypothetical protein
VGEPAHRDLGDPGQDTHGDSICPRIDDDHVAILLTGDLKKKAWIGWRRVTGTASRRNQAMSFLQNQKRDTRK